MKRNNVLKFIFLFLLSLTPVIWFKGRSGVLIDGVDTNFPLNPAIWFARRFFVWSNAGNLGSDFSASTAGAFFHFLQFIPYKLGFPLQGVELFSLIFWFALIILGSYFLARLFFPKKSFSQLIFVCLYSLNIYLFNSFENVKVANLSLISSIPFGLSILILLRRKKIKRPTALLFSSLTGIILAGSGVNPAYIICFFLILFLYVISEIIVNISSREEIFEIAKDFLVVSCGLIAVNLFWIFPTISYILTNISASNSIGAIGFSNWVNSLSENTSFINVLRMQGAWDWYSIDTATGLPLYIPYATRYFGNPFFIGFSFFVPGLAFLAYLFRRKFSDSLYLFFSFALVIGLFLTAGTHSPTGGLFSFFGRHVPFFSLFRSPWYIFAPLVGLSIAGLVGLLIDSIQDKIPQKFIFYIFSSVFIFGILIYSYPLILGKIFRPNFNGTFYIKFPQYVFDAGNYLSGKSGDGRILSYPDDNIEKFNWGYSGVDSILNLFADKEVVFTTLNETGTPIAQSVTSIYSSIKKGEISRANSLANILGIDQIFEKKDQISLSPPLPNAITSHKIASFGNWNFDQFPFPNPSPKIYSANSLYANFSVNDSSGNLSLLNEGEILVSPSDSVLKRSGLANYLGYIVKADNSQLSEIQAFQKNPFDLNFKVNKKNVDNVEYDFQIESAGSYQPVLENYQLDLFGLVNQNKISAILDDNTISLNVDHSDDSYLYLSSIDIAAGKHKLVIPLQYKNLIDKNKFKTNGNARFNAFGDILDVSNKSDKDVFFDYTISHFDPFSYYLVSVDSKFDYGKSPEIFVNQVGSINQLFKSQQEVLPIFSEFDNYNFYFIPVGVPSVGEIHLVAPADRSPQGTRVEFKNLVVFKLFTNDLFFKKSAASKSDGAKIKFVKNSPVSYSGEIINSAGPQLIVFNENFSPNWELKVNSGNSKIFHFTTNSYANGWYIDGLKGNYQFTIYYKPQRLQDIGRLVGCILIIGEIGWISLKLVKRKNGKKK